MRHPYPYPPSRGNAFSNRRNTASLWAWPRYGHAVANRSAILLQLSSLGQMAKRQSLLHRLSQGDWLLLAASLPQHAQCNVL
jgi:hypothetical protein